MEDKNKKRERKGQMCITIGNEIKAKFEAKAKELGLNSSALAVIAFRRFLKNPKI